MINKGTIDNSPTKSGNNVFTGNNTFNNKTNVNYDMFHLLADTRDNSNDGGRIIFDSAAAEPNAGKNEYIDRNNGRLRFFGFDSGGTIRIPFQVDIQNETVIFSKPASTYIASNCMPDFTAGTSFTSGNNTSKPCGVLIQAVWNGSESSMTTPFSITLAGGVYSGTNKYKNSIFFICDSGVKITFTNATCTVYPLKGV